MSTGDGFPGDDFPDIDLPTPPLPDIISGLDLSMYPTDGPEGGYGDPSEGRCCEEKICNCLGSTLTRIANAHDKIAAILDERLGKLCDNVDKCIDKIIEALRKRLEKGTKTCDQCKADLAAGLGGTLEYAVACAGACLEKRKADCSAAHPEDEGQPCEGCGKSPCCCRDNACVPCGPEDEKKKKYIGWCNPLTLAISVSKQGEPGPGPEWQQVALSDTEESAAIEAATNCKSVKTVSGGPRPSLDLPSGLSGTWCDIELFKNPSQLAAMVQPGSAQNATAGVAQFFTALGRFGLDGINVNNAGEAIAGAFTASLGIQTSLARHIIDSAGPLTGCTSPAMTGALQWLALLGHVNNATGIDLTPWVKHLEYAINISCPQRFIGPDQAMAAYLADGINRDDLDTLWRMHSYCPGQMEPILHASKAKPVPLQLAMMRRRGMLNSNGYHQGMRHLGYLETQTAEQLFTLTEQVPTMSDLIPLMIRDADDESIPYWPESDAIFLTKYGKNIRKWAEWQGVPEEFFKLYWRAHWSIPSPTQLFEFWRRLRHNPAFGGVDVMKARIKQALIQQDILPAWHDAYLAISHLPLTRRDVRRAFEIGVLDEQQVNDAFIQIGHSDEVAKTLTDYTVKLRDVGLRGHSAIRLWRQFAIDRAEVERRMLAEKVPQAAIDNALRDAEQTFDKSPYATAFVGGYIDRQQFVTRLTGIGVSQVGASKIADRLGLRIKKHPALKQYAVGLIDRSTTNGRMTADGMDVDIAATLLDMVDVELNVAHLQRCQNGIKGRYLGGELDRAEAISELKSFGTTPAAAQRLLYWWGCEKSSIGRAIPTSTLCDLLEDAVITAGDFSKRLVNIGYEQPDANLMVGNCLRAIDERRAKIREREEKDKVAQAKREMREAAAAARRLQQETEKLERENAKRVATRKGREKQLLAATQKLLAKCDCDLFSAMGATRLARESTIRNYGLGIDETLAILIRAAEAMDPGSLDSYQTAVVALAEEIASVPIEEGAE